jgi:hypothetical protein
MSSAGHVLDMITRIKNNEALKKERKEKSRKLTELFRKDGWNDQNIHLRETAISDENLEQLKLKIKSDSVNEKRFGFIYTLIITILVCLSLFAIAYLGFFK